MGEAKHNEVMALDLKPGELSPAMSAYSAPKRAMLDFAVKIAKASHEIGETDRDALRQHGFSERDIWDIAAVSSFFNMSNRMASAVDMRPNGEYHAQAR